MGCFGLLASWVDRSWVMVETRFGWYQMEQDLRDDKRVIW
jgi:hypothetical protein